MQTEVID